MRVQAIELDFAGIPKDQGAGHGSAENWYYSGQVYPFGHQVGSVAGEDQNEFDWNYAVFVRGRA